MTFETELQPPTSSVDPRWVEFLRSQGAVFEGHRLVRFGPPDVERDPAADNVLVDLSHTALVRVSGADSKTFLNGQLTNDVTRLDASHSHLSAWCSPKGRMLALLRVMEFESGYLLLVPRALRDDVVGRLRKYVLRAKVVIEPADESLVHFGVSGIGAAARLRDLLEDLPGNVDELRARKGLRCVRVRGNAPRYELIGGNEAAIALWKELSGVAKPVGAPVWDWLDIVAGVPTVLPPTSDLFVPQMANLDLIDAVNFDKGCYTGQEIVARVHYRGRIKQRMYRAHVAHDSTPQPGDPIYSLSLAEQSAGTVVIAAPSPEGGNDLLAVIQSESVADGSLHLHGPDGPTLTIEPLPYPVPR